ncbi:MAG: hypothetical protein Q8Q96_00565 [bacterium]|nr:hypothetical protein [bacterium]
MEETNMVNGNKSTQEALIKHQPVPEDPADRRIVNLIEREFTPTSWAQQTFVDIREMLVKYYRDSLQHPNDSGHIHDRTQKLLSDIAKRANTKIVRGGEYLRSLPKQSPVFLLTNHLGAYKLANVDPLEDLKIDIGLRSMHALPLFHASNQVVAAVLRDNLYIAAYEFPGVIGEIQKSADGVIVPLEGTGRIDYLAEETRRLMQRHPNSALSVLPEGGTSGKRNGGGPYDLEPFRKGVFAIAYRVGCPLIPVVQYFDPNSGFELAILPRIEMTPPEDIEGAKEYFTQLADKTRVDMQAWLDQRKQAA